MQYQIPCGTTGIRTIFSRYLTKAEKGRQAYRRSTRTDRRVTLWNVSEQPRMVALRYCNNYPDVVPDGLPIFWKLNPVARDSGILHKTNTHQCWNDRGGR